jgi:hypothetical protein
MKAHVFVQKLRRILRPIVTEGKISVDTRQLDMTEFLVLMAHMRCQIRGAVKAASPTTVNWIANVAVLGLANQHWVQISNEVTK